MIPNPKAVAAAAGWWRRLQPSPDGTRPGDRAALARLRRCATAAEAMQEPAAIALFRLSGATQPQDLADVAPLAAVLAHVREHQPGISVARQVGPDDPDRPETATMSPLRFRRLLETATPDERLTQFRRLVALAGGALDVQDLARAMLDLADPRRAEERRRRWIYDYWNAGQPTTGAASDTAPAEEPAA